MKTKKLLALLLAFSMIFGTCSAEARQMKTETEIKTETEVKNEEDITENTALKIHTETPKASMPKTEEITKEEPAEKSRESETIEQTAEPEALNASPIEEEVLKTENAAETVKKEEQKNARKSILTEESEAENKEYTCTLSVRCDTILNNIINLNPSKKDLVPSDGIIFSEREVTFYEGESVFNVLRREMKLNKIHMEFKQTPIYNSAYIEGIANLYEFDCGALSGWMYRVNDIFPNYGCSACKLENGDRVEWIYTCDLGADIGSESGKWQGN